MVSYPAEVTEIDIDGRTFWVRPVGSWVLQSNNVVAEALPVSLDKPLEWAAGFFFGRWANQFKRRQPTPETGDIGS